MWKLLEFQRTARQPEHEDCPGPECGCIRRGLASCLVELEWDELADEFPSKMLEDASAALRLARRYGPRPSDPHAGPELRYPRTFSRRVFAIVRLAEQQIDAYNVAFLRQAEAEAKAAAAER